MDLQLFTLTPDEILPQKRFRPQDLAIVVVSNSKMIYIYRTESVPSQYEMQSGEIYERIMNRFLNPNVLLLKTLNQADTDEEEVREIKNFLLQAIQRNKFAEFIKRFRVLPFLGGLRKNHEKMVNYSQNFLWRSRLSNRSNIWWLITANFIGIAIIAILLSYKIVYGLLPIYTTPLIGSPWISWIENLGAVLGICVLVSVILLLLNISFLLFPLKFPIHPPTQK